MASRGRAPDKRDRILQAAIHVFAEKGFFVARVADVAREAGVADGTIYLYFKSKEALLQGLFEESMDRVLVWMRELAASPAPPSERLLAIFERYAQFTEDEPRLAEVLTVQLRESGKLMAEIASQKFGEFLQILTAIIEDGQRRGHFRSDLRARTIARVMYGALDELSLSWVMSDARWALSAATREVLDVFLHGIVAGRPHHGAAATADPATADPATADPATADPATADPATADPATADPATADPATADLATADLATADLATADLATADLATAEPPVAGDTKSDEAMPPPAQSPVAPAQGRRISRSNV